LNSNVNKYYWIKNIRLLVTLLSVWFLVAFVFGILLVDILNQFQFFGFKLGFWIAQQGSQIVFILLIFVYVYKMNKLDKSLGFDEIDE